MTQEPSPDDLLTEYQFGEDDKVTNLGFTGWTEEDEFKLSGGGADPAEAEEVYVDDVMRGFRERAGKEETRLNTWVTSGHYVVVVFATSEQRRAFLPGAEWGTENTYYVDGCLLAEQMGVPIPETPAWRAPRIDKDYASRALSAVAVDEERKE